MRSVLKIGLLVAVGFSRLSSADELPPGVENTQNPSDISLTPEESLARIAVPDGFRVTQFAAEPDIRRPIAFDFDDRGRMWVVENYSHPKWHDRDGVDRVVILEDTDGDGRFDKRSVFYDKGRYLTGIAVGHGGVWLANTPELTFIPDGDRDDVADGPPQSILDGFQISSNNVLNNLHWGPDGWLYGAIGLSTKSLVGAPGSAPENRTEISRGIWRYHPTRHVFEKVAEGMVNPWGADFNEYGDLITANTVLAHLWHIVPGMYCERRANERDNPYAYQRIQTIANHLHWGGGGWQSSRNPSSRKGKAAEGTSGGDHEHDDEYQQHSVAGGGHAHCGAMIYLGENWPEKYRGSFFTNNLHGNRVNNDLLQPNGSTYTGVHAQDLFPANDPWFRGMNIKYGPDGGVYISDWHDFGECHDSDGSHRSSGRIYKFTWGLPEYRSVDLQGQSDLDLVSLLSSRNEWLARHSSRILQERAQQGALAHSAVAQMQDLLESQRSEAERLRALWALYRVDALSNDRLHALTTDRSVHVRRWAVRFLVDRLPCDMARVVVKDRPARAALTEVLVQAANDVSPRVRLEVACGLQRLKFADRIKIAKQLVAFGGDETDPYLPLMIWYGVEPAVAAYPDQGLAMADSSQLSVIRRFVARRLMDVSSPATELVLDAVLRSQNEKVQGDLLCGMRDGLSDQGSQPQPENWPQVVAVTSRNMTPETSSAVLQLATTFGDRVAIQRVRKTLDDESLPEAQRQDAFRTLMALSDGISTEDLHILVSASNLMCDDALGALVVRSNDQTADVLLERYQQLSPQQRQLAVSVLVTRRDFAVRLLRAIREGRIPADDVSAWSLQQLRSFRDEDVRREVAAVWANDVDGIQRADEIERLLSLMTSEYVQQGDVRSGRAIFDRTCARCHRLFGDGGTIAPDLTGSGRRKTDYVVRNLIDPSAEIDAAYRLTTVVTIDGRVINGFIMKQDDRWLSIRNQDGTVRLNMNDVDEVVTSDVSMMPEGMLRTLSDEQFRDLLLYLSSEEQIDG